MKTEAEFWNWFVQHEAELFDFRVEHEVERERLFNELAKELQKVHRELSFEFGPNDTPREFVITACGIKEAFPSAKSLVNSAPNLERWQITALRPRRSLTNVVEFRGKRVDPKEVQFTLLSDGKVAGVRLFIPGYQETDSALKQIAYLLLDEALGEYDVESHLGPIKMFATENDIEGERYPFIELPKQFDRLLESFSTASDNSLNSR